MAESMDENLNEEDNPQYQKEIKAINEESSRYKLSIWFLFFYHYFQFCIQLEIYNDCSAFNLFIDNIRTRFKLSEMIIEKKNISVI